MEHTLQCQVLVFLVLALTPQQTLTQSAPPQVPLQVPQQAQRPTPQQVPALPAPQAPAERCVRWAWSGDVDHRTVWCLEWKRVDRK